MQLEFVEFGVFLGECLLHLLLDLQHLDLFGLKLQFPDLEVLDLQFVFELCDIQSCVRNLSHLFDHVGALLKDLFVLLFYHVALHQEYLILLHGFLLRNLHYTLFQTNLNLYV